MPHPRRDQQATPQREADTDLGVVRTYKYNAAWWWELLH